MKINYIIACFLFFVLFNACKKKQPNNAMVVHVISEPTDLHPTNGNSALRSEINLYIHTSLLKLDFKTGKLIPCLVKDLPVISNNGLDFTYEIKSNVFWDDNTPISALDVLFTSKANKCFLTNNTALKSFWDNVMDIEIDKTNPKKFVVKMTKPYILNTWFWSDLPIIQSSFYDKNKTLSKYSFNQLMDSVFVNQNTDLKQWVDTFNSSKYYDNPNFISGSGPYKISKWEKGVSLTLEKKKSHFTENCHDNWFCEANAEKIIFKINSNNSSTKLELKNGLIDVSAMVDFTTFTELSNDSEFTKKYYTKLADTYNYLYIAMNMKPDGKVHKKIFNDVLVRKAMALLTPYDQINKTIFNNQCKRILGPVSTIKSEYNNKLTSIDFNIKQAKVLLNKAGWTDSDNDQILDKIIDGEKVNFEFNLNFMATQKQWEDIAKQIAESLSKVDIYAKLNPLDYNGFVDAAMNHKFDMSIGAWQSSSQPEDFTQLWHSSSWINNGLNFTGFGNTYSDSLINKINTSINEAERLEFSKEFQQIVYKEQPYIFLFSQLRRVIINKRWQNIEVYNEYPGVLLNTLKLNN
jgi:ABC-type transport system substrate-binding protein